MIGERSNAEAGYTNGSVAPFGYRKVVALTVGKKQRKKLAIDDAEAVVVKRVFALYLGTENAEGPIGIKKIAQRLNDEGERLRGRLFSTSVVEAILKRTAYTGFSFYGTTDSRSRLPRPESEWVRFETPRIIDDEVFAQAQSLLAERNPRKNAPQTLAGPTVLAGIAKCGLCKGGMMLWTGKSGQYKYLTCATGATKGRGAFACTGQSIRMDQADDLVVKILLDEVLAHNRLSRLFDDVQVEQLNRSSDLDQEMLSRRAQVSDASKKLSNLLDLASDDPSLRDDESFKKKLSDIRRQKDAQTAQIRALEARRAVQVTNLTPERLLKFDQRIRDLMDAANPNVRKQWVRHFVAEVIIYPNHIRILGPEDQVLRTLQFDQKHPTLGVPSFARDWRTRHDSNV
jgi:site-specific DNA recombinase